MSEAHEDVSPFPPTDEVEEPGPIPPLTMKDVYLEWLKWDEEEIKVTREGIAACERIARKYLDNKDLHYGYSQLAEDLKQEIAELKKDMERVREKLSPGSKASRDSIRFRME